MTVFYDSKEVVITSSLCKTSLFVTHSVQDINFNIAKYAEFRRLCED